MSEFDTKEAGKPAKKEPLAASPVEELTKSFETRRNADVLAELSALELEEKQLDLEIKRETVAKIKAKRQAQLDETRAKIQATVGFLANRKAAQDRCNHLKGGQGHEAIINGIGTDAMHSIIKHKLPHGKHFVVCTRCLKEVHPPVPILGLQGDPEWSTWINWPTDNSPSGSSVFLFERTGAAA
jgi:hypothetical protein